MPKYHKKPIIVEAEQFWPDKQPWPTGVERITPCRYDATSETGYRVKTINGYVAIEPGSWRLLDLAGYPYPCEAEVFAATYEPEPE